MKIRIEHLYRNNDTNSKLLGVVKIVLNDSIMINNIKIINNNGSLFVAMPSIKINDQYEDVCHPATIELRNDITNAVINAYKNNIFEVGYSETFYISDIRVYKIDNGRCKAMVNLLLNNIFAINYCYIVDNTKPTDKDINIAFSFQVDANGVPYVSILSDSLKEEILKKSFEEYKSIFSD